MSKGMIILISLILITMTLSFWYGRNREAPPWMKCKESLFSQVILNKCTPSSLSTPSYREDKIDNENEKFEN
tara:strand:- start:202 stop:417 length:216 start_codon:yes stop_codon:yes gene_type:complete